MMNLHPFWSRTFPLVLASLLFSIFARSQTITTIAGSGDSGYSGDGGSATLCKMKTPGFTSTDGNGNIYFADLFNNVIRKISKTGIITTIAGTGVAGYSGDGGPATLAQLDGPIHAIIDKDDNMLIVDYANHVIRKITPSGTITTIAGTGVLGYSGDGGPAISAKLSSPYAIAIDATGNIFFSDAGNNVVRKIDGLGTITTIAGCGLFGDSGEGGPATAAKLKYPGLLALHPKTGELYFPDHINRKVMKVNTMGIISTVAGSGISGYSGDGGPATDALMKNPNAVQFDTAGNLYISDIYAHVIRKVDVSGIISTIAGTGIAGFNGDGGMALSTQLNQPNLGSFDKWGNLYISDGFNYRIRRINYHPIAVKNVPNNNTHIAIYPNPAGNEITISADKPIINLTIINTLGVAVLTINTNKKVSSIDISSLPSGVYIIKADGVYAGKFLKE